MARRWLWIGLAGLAGVIVLIVAASLALSPAQTSPAFARAEALWNAAGAGDDDAVDALLSDELRAWAAANCPQGRAGACLRAYAPPEWGRLLRAVFRRSAPEGAAWNVELIATYELETGVSGVCAHVRVEPRGDAWQVTEWAGFLWCGDARAVNMARNPQTPNRAP